MKKLYCIQETSSSKVFNIKDMLKANGFKFAWKTKKWYTEDKDKAEALLKILNLSNIFKIRETSKDELMGKITTNTIQNDTISLKEVKSLGLSDYKIRKLIEENKMKVMLFSLDSMGRKINKRFDVVDVQKALKL